MADNKRARRLVKSIPFSNQDGNFEITAFATESGYEVHATRGGQPLPLVYSVEYDTAFDLQHDRNADACDMLIDAMLCEILNKAR